MARIRTIKPSFFRSSTVTSLPISTRLTFIGLWITVDDAGRAVDDARLVKSDVWPLDDSYTIAKIKKDLALLEEAGLIQFYSVGTRDYFAIVNWGEHQRINRPQESSIPEPGQFSDDSVNDHGTISDDSVTIQWRKGKERKGREGRRASQISHLFEVTDEMRTWAKDNNIQSVIDTETEKFIDHFRAKGEPKKDWVAAWRNWMRRADEYRKPAQSAATPQSKNVEMPGVRISESDAATMYGAPIKLPGEE